MTFFKSLFILLSLSLVTPSFARDAVGARDGNDRTRVGAKGRSGYTEECRYKKGRYECTDVRIPSSASKGLRELHRGPQVPKN